MTSDRVSLDVHLRQRYFYRNDGQGRFSVHSNPYIQIESPALEAVGGVVKWSVLGNGLHLAASKSLVSGENGNDSRGNFGREFISKRELDDWLGPGTGAKFFAKDFTVRMSVRNTIRGISHLVVGTWTVLYGS